MRDKGLQMEKVLWRIMTEVCENEGWLINFSNQHKKCNLGTDGKRVPKCWEQVRLRSLESRSQMGLGMAAERTGLLSIYLLHHAT